MASQNSKTTSSQTLDEIMAQFDQNALSGNKMADYSKPIDQGLHKHRLFLYSIILLLILLVVSIGSMMILNTTIKTKKTSYVCPKEKQIDCMPMVGKDKQNQCDPKYLQWLQKNCPGTQVAY